MTPFEKLQTALKDPELEQIKGLRPGLYRARCWEIVEDKDHDVASKEGVIKVSLEDQFVVSGFFFARAANKHNIVYPTPISEAVKILIAKCEKANGTRMPPALDGDVIWVLFDGGEISAQGMAYWLPMGLEDTSYVSEGTAEGTGDINSKSSEDERLKHRFERGAYKVVYGSNILKFGRNEILKTDAETEKSHLNPAAKKQAIKGIYLGVHDATIESLLHLRLHIRDTLEVATGVAGSAADKKLKNIRVLVENLWLQADKLKIGKEGEMQEMVKGKTTEEYLQDLVDWINAAEDILNNLHEGYKVHTHPSAVGHTGLPVELPAVQAALDDWTTTDPDILWDVASDPGDLLIDQV